MVWALQLPNLLPWESCQTTDHGGGSQVKPCGLLELKQWSQHFGETKEAEVSGQNTGEEIVSQRKDPADQQRTLPISGRVLISAHMQGNFLKLWMKSSERITANSIWCSNVHRVWRSTCSYHLDWITGNKKNLKNLKQLETFLTKYQIWKLAPDEIANPNQSIITRNRETYQRYTHQKY